MKKTTVICIAGMHRSGTSMVTRLINCCGVNLGPEDDLLPPCELNTEGYWESVSFLNINKQILDHFGGKWDLVPILEDGWELSEQLSIIEGQALRLIKQFNSYTVWGWKDPRNSLTFPFWKKLIPNIKLVICLRNPMEVARSLSVCGKASLPFSLNLWSAYSRHLMDALKYQDYIVTHYRSYFLNPQKELRRVLDYLEIPATSQIIDQACGTILPFQSHHSQTLSDIIKAKGDYDSTNLVLNQYIELCAEAGHVYLDRHLNECHEIVKKSIEISINADELIELQKTLAQIYGSLTWKLLAGYESLLLRILPPGSRRRLFYNRVISALGISANEGWGRRHDNSHE